MPERLRIALISTPRSGNTWFRHLIASSFGISMASRHAMDEAAWSAMPDEVVVQIHWPREPEFEARLAREGFRVITLARHPLDVLISILHVAVHDVESESWLLGRDGDERPLWGAWPESQAFLEYATGKRASSLLGVSADWWNAPGAVSVRYEDLVADAVGVLRSLETHLGPARGSIEGAVEAASMGRMRKSYTNNHFWMGQPGLWRELLTADRARAISDAHRGVFETLGYAADGKPELTEAEASRRWLELNGPELGATLRRNTAAFRAQLGEIESKARSSLELAHATRLECDAAVARAATVEQGFARQKALAAALDEEAAQLYVQIRALRAELRAAYETAAETAAATAGQLRSVTDQLTQAESALRWYQSLEGIPMRVAARLHWLRVRFPSVRSMRRALRRTVA